MILDFAVITVVNGDVALRLFGGVMANDPRLSDARPPLAHHHAQADVHNLEADLEARQLKSEKGQAGGYAGLNHDRKLDGAWQAYGTTANTAMEGNDPRVIHPSRILTNGDFVLLGARGHVLWK